MHNMYPEEAFDECAPNRKRICAPVDSSEVLVMELQITPHHESVWDDSASCEDDQPPPSVKSCKVLLTQLATIPQPEFVCDHSDSSEDNKLPPIMKSCKVLIRKLATTSQAEFVCDDSDSSQDEELPLKMKSCRVHLTKLVTSRYQSDRNDYGSSEDDLPLREYCKLRKTKLQRKPNKAKQNYRQRNECNRDVSDSNVISSSEETTDSDYDDRSYDCDSSEDGVPRRKYCKPRKTKLKTKARSECSKDDSDCYEATSYEDSDVSNDDDCSYDDKAFRSDKKRIAVFNFKSHRLGVSKFINEATIAELQGIKTMSVSKIDTILELRPFDDWQHMSDSFESHKNLSTQLLTHCHDFLMSRNNIVKVITKCLEMCEKLHSRIAARTSLCNQPSILNPKFKLADYQLAGLNWLAVLNQEKSNGILADEMGLGKTIQIIAFLAYLKETGKAKHPHLIVVPATTLDNWNNEFAKWCPSLIVHKYFGSLEDRRSLRLKYRNTKMKGIDVILTTYKIVHSTPEDRKMFQVTPIHYVVFDEAHMLKNMNSQRYSFLYLIKSEHRLLLTGTPLQNTLLELISLLCFVMPSVFESKSEDLKSMFQSTASHKKKDILKTGELISPFHRHLIDQVKLIMKPFVLRRLKTDVLESLPTKTEHTIKVRLAPIQKAKYKEMVENYSRKKGSDHVKSKCSPMTFMMNMRKLSNHPLLMRYHYDDKMVFDIARQLSTNPLYKRNSNPEYIFEELAILSDFQLYQTIQNYNIHGFDIPEDLILNSGKFYELDNLLPTLKLDGSRVLIFSQFVMMLDIIERYLDIRGHNYLRIDGNTDVAERQDLIDQYMTESSIFVFLLSTRAGGLGINLTKANTVIIHDIDFNPYNDKQAEDRCHRIGQTSPVTVYRFISEGTIEEGMISVANQKLNLEREVNGDKKNGVCERKSLARLLTMALGVDEFLTDFDEFSLKDVEFNF